jgi:hypothetical protein
LERVTEWRGIAERCQVCGATLLARVVDIYASRCNGPVRTDIEMRCGEKDCFARYGSWVHWRQP